MTTTRPTLAKMMNLIIDSLRTNKLPTNKDALELLNLIIDWLSKEPNGPERRSIFRTIFKMYKKRCISADPIKRQGELWAAINAITPVWDECMDAIIAAQNKKAPSPTLFPSFFNSFKKPEYEGLTLINH